MITAGTLFSIIFGSIGIGLATLAVIGFLRARRSSDYWSSGWSITSGFSALCAAFCLIPAIIGLVPFKADYLRFQEVRGTVAQVESMRLEENFVLTFEGNPQPYKITDTRAALVKPGDELSLLCVKQWEWASTNHGYACKWN
jgi:hypothetical protein